MKGKQLAESCVGRHGEKGISQKDDYPSLAGQLTTYNYKQLHDYADNKRTHVFNELCSCWFVSLPSAQGKRSQAALDKAEVVVAKGNGKKIIPLCFTCHGSDGDGERQDIPGLAGQ